MRLSSMLFRYFFAEVDAALPGPYSPLKKKPGWEPGANSH